MLPRAAAPHLQDLARWYPVLAVTGPRQSGKTTLVRQVFAGKPYVSLEDPDVRAAALADPRAFLALYPDGAVIDEAQHAPALFSYLQTRVDADRTAPARSGGGNGDGFRGSRSRSSSGSGGGGGGGGANGDQPLWVLTGSQHFGLVAAITQSLAGRVGLLHLLPLSLAELAAAGHAAARVPLAQCLWQGGYAPVVVGSVPPGVWYADYVATYVERDVRQLVNVRDLAPFMTFLRMCAARCGQALNLAALGADCGVTANTARAWLSILEASYIVFTLPQHHISFGRRLVKAPKLYFYDTGLAAWLCGLRSADELAHSSLRGPLFETWGLSEAVKARSHHRLEPTLHCWRDQQGVEVDLLIDHGNALTPVEFKAGQTLASDWAAGLKRYASRAATAGTALHGAALVYGGEMPLVMAGLPVVPWRDWPARVRSLLGGSA